MVPQLHFQAGAALMFGELHDSILMDRVRGISYSFVCYLITPLQPSSGAPDYG